jgi:hypothetical protein
VSGCVVRSLSRVDDIATARLSSLLFEASCGLYVQFENAAGANVG